MNILIKNENVSENEEIDNIVGNRQEIDAGYQKRKAYLDILKKFNEYYKVLIDMLYKILCGKSNSMDNTPVTVFTKRLQDAAIKTIRKVGETFGINKDTVDMDRHLYINMRYIKFKQSVSGNLKILVSFLYKDRFKNAARTKKAVQWYWDTLKADTGSLINDLVDYFYSNRITNEIESDGETEDTVPDYETVTGTSNYELTGNEAAGGIKTRYRNNIQAIKTLKFIEQEGRQATGEEKAVLSSYVGWGSIPQVFSKHSSDWEKERQELSELLTEDEYRMAKASTLNAHYTCIEIIDFMYRALERFGFDGGSTIEPALGSGNYFGAYPKRWQKGSHLFGIEIDSLTGRIARLLYPEADIRVQGYEDCLIPDNSFDVAISNVPFGDYQVHDPRYNHLKLSIHDYFFAKSLDVVRPGGIIAFITSIYTMDKQDESFRKYVADRADLIGAVRLPNNTFKKNAGTEVTTDILFVQKREPDAMPKGVDWVKIVKNEDGISLNEYYAANHGMLIGKMALWKRMYGSESTTLMPVGENLEEMLQNALLKLPAGIYKPIAGKNRQMSLEDYLSRDETIPAIPSVKKYAYTVCNGSIYQREDSTMRLVGMKGKKVERLRGMIEVREILKKVISAQAQDMHENVIKAAQDELSRAYGTFIRNNGYLSDKVNKDIFREDPESSLLLALETSRDGAVEKTDIFSKRTIKPARKITKVNDCHEALAVSLNETGSVDLPFMSRITGRSEDELVEDLKGRIFLNPQTQIWETAEEYLSGNIALKLQVVEIAVENATDGKKYLSNVEALKKALPELLKPEDITVRLGAAWIPEGDIKDFIAHLLEMEPAAAKRNISVKYTKSVATWTVDVFIGYSVQNTKTWGTDRMNAVRIVEHSLNLQQVSVYDTHSDGRVELNKKETIAARAKQDVIKEEFIRWIFDDPERRKRLTELYNEKFNNIRLRTYNGDYLSFPGMNSQVTLNKHQKDAVARVINGGNTLLAHCTGSGKTFTCIAGAMELKRLGIIQKPVFVVPNSLTEQWGQEFARLYPNVNILVCTKRDFEKDNRKRLISRIVTGEWDGIIIAHSQFTKIPVSKGLLAEMIRSQVDEIADAIEELETQNDRASTRLVKRLEKLKKNLEEDMAEFYNLSAKDDVINFEDLGVDQIFLDESDEFKNLGVITKMQNIAGIGTTRSQKAFDLYVKARYLYHKRGGKGGIVFATATPITNSVSEMYIIQKYLAFEVLKEKGLGHFDAWASTFGEIAAAMEIAPDGGFRTKQRFSKFYNLVELLAMFRDFADVQTDDMLSLPVPKTKGGKPTVVSAEATKELKDFVGVLVERAEAIRNNRVNPKEDNMLMVTNEGRKAALDIRLIDPSMPDDPGSKVNMCINNVFDIWKDTEDKRLTQLIFCDLSTPGGQGFDLYADIKTKLAVRGVPADEIAFIHDADTEDRKTRLYDRVRAGIVRILLGSTAKMGAGVNVMDKLIALHHLDAPWRPRDVQQREGRIIRQGNRNDEVYIYRYVTKNSFDAYIWQLLENKSRFINQVMKGKTTARSAEDIDSNSLSYAEVKAIASGNPLVLEKIEVDAELQRLHSLKSSYLSNRYRMQDELDYILKHEKQSEKAIKGYTADLALRKDVMGESFTMVVNGTVFTERRGAGKEILSLANEFKDAAGDQGVGSAIEIGGYAGLRMHIWFKKNYFVDDEFQVVLKGSEEYRIDITSIPGTMVNKIEGKVYSIEHLLSDETEKLQRLRKQENGLKSELSRPFEKEMDLIRLTQRQQELNMILDRGRATELLDVEAEAV